MRLWLFGGIQRDLYIGNCELAFFQAIGSYRSHGNFIAASAAYMAFNWDTNGSNLAVLPLDTKGRQHKVRLQKCIHTLLEHTVWICNRSSVVG